MTSGTPTLGTLPSRGQRDLFLSYNSSDREAVVKVRQVLSLRNISTFYDRADLTPGQPWFDELETALRQVLGVAVFVGKDGLGTIQKREMQYALARQASEEKQGRPFPVIPVLLSGSDAEMVSAFLALNTWVDLRRDVEDAYALDSFVRAVRQRPGAPPEEPAAICPYRGLNVFREEDAPLFFGREAFSQRLLAQVLKQDLVVVIGRSGSGKSSVVQAGLLPLLRLQRPPEETWEAVIFTPGGKPFHRLAAQLVPLWSPPNRDQTDIGTESEKLGNRLSAREVTLAGFIELALQHLPDTGRLLAVVDQFEELFTQTAQEEQRDQFVDQLLESTRESKLKLVLTLRADFYGKAIGLRRLSDAIEAGVVNVGEMTREELKRAVEEPARRAGLRFESGLVERILDHVEQQPGTLPLLEYALTELWRRRQGGQLTHGAYDAIGGVEGAISKRAEEQFEKLSFAQKEIALPALSRLVHVSSAAEESTDSRHVVNLSEFDADAQAVMRTLAAREARLVVMGRDESSGQETVEVAHEALIRGWGDLKKCIDKNREFLLWRQQLLPFLNKWRALGENRNSALLHGVYLAEALRWLRERSKDLSSEERQFIKASEGPKIRSRLWKRSLAATVGMIALAMFGALWWTRRDGYQIQRTLDTASELIKSADDPWAGEWVSVLSLSGRTPQAMAQARSIAQTGVRGEAFGTVALALAKSGLATESAEAAQEALRTVPLMNDSNQKQTATSAAVQALALSGRFEEALSALRRMNDAQAQASCLGAMAKVLAEAGKVDPLIEAARHPDGPMANESGLAEAARNLASAGHPDEGLTLAQLIKTPSWKAYAVGGVAQAFGHSGKTNVAGPLAEEALRTAQEVTKQPERDYTFNWVVRALADAGKPSEALGLTAQIQDKTAHDQALMDTAERLAQSGNTAQALGLVREARDPKSQELIYGTILIDLAKAGKGQEAADALLRLKSEGLSAVNVLGWPLDLPGVVEFLAEQKPLDALPLARQGSEPGSRRHMLATVAERLQKTGNSEDARKVALEALAQSGDNLQAGDDRALSSRADDFATIMIVLGNVGMSREARRAGNEALAIAELIPDDSRKSDAFLTVATAFARIHSYRRARQTAELCTSSDDKLSASAAILREYTLQHHPELASSFSETSQ